MSSQRGRIFKTATGYGYYFSITVNGKRQQYKKQKFATKNDAEKALTGAGTQTQVSKLLNSFSFHG
jgi:hypothetical protein